MDEVVGERQSEDAGCSTSDANSGKSPSSIRRAQEIGRHLQRLRTVKGDIFPFLQRTNNISFLCVPFYFGFRRIHVTKTIFVNGVYETVSSVRYTINDSTYEYLESLKKYLQESNTPLPLYCFTFDPSVDPFNYICNNDSEFLYSSDITGGKERLKIPAICYKKKDSPPRLLSTYTTHMHPTKNLGAKLHHDKEFLVCCDCPDDCSDKMKCPCFLTTLDNCGMNERLKMGDENIGYQFQRLYNVVLSGIFECNSQCKCKKFTCFNRVSQNGTFCQLELFHSNKKDWSVRTVHDIPSGTFVCLYMGEIISKAVAEEYVNDFSQGRWVYLADLKAGNPDKEGYEENVEEPPGTPPPPPPTRIIEPEQPSNKECQAPPEDPSSVLERVHKDLHISGYRLRSSGREKNINRVRQNTPPVASQHSSLEEETSEADPSLTSSSDAHPPIAASPARSTEAPPLPSKGKGKKKKKYPPLSSLLDFTFSLDGYDKGNIGKYLNHSCDPNLMAQLVFWDCHDLRFPYLAFFASKNIKAGDELTWDYKYENEDDDGQAAADGEHHHSDQDNVKRRMECHCNADECKGYLC